MVEEEVVHATRIGAAGDVGSVRVGTIVASASSGRVWRRGVDFAR